MTVLLMLGSNGRTFRAQAPISQTELPTMHKNSAIVGYIVRAVPDNIGAPIPDLPHSSALMMPHFHGK